MILIKFNSPKLRKKAKQAKNISFFNGLLLNYS